jgi:hypothetical protein
MKKAIFTFLFLCLITTAFSQQKDWAIGAKIGDPLGFNLRHYLKNDKNAIEVNYGVYGGIWNVKSSYKDGNFTGSGFSFSGVYLWHNEMGGASNFKNYYGFGGQYVSRSYYDASKKEIPITGLGGIGEAGIEYFVPDSPFSILLEVGAYVELVPAILYLHPQAGAGVRLNF